MCLIVYEKKTLYIGIENTPSGEIVAVYKTILSLIYACGLRRGELLRLKPQDILSDRNLLHIKQSKGKKDRVVPLSSKLLEMLREYYKTYRYKQACNFALVAPQLCYPFIRERNRFTLYTRVTRSQKQ